MRKRAFATTLLLSIAGIASLYCQSIPVSPVSVRQKFADQGQLKWVLTFRGTWQSFHPVTMVLGFDGNVYQGSMTCGSDSQVYELIGAQQDGAIILQEIDSTGRTSGYLNIEITDGKMAGHWWSTDFTRSATLSLTSEEVVAIRRFEPELLVFRGSAFGSSTSMMLQREEPDMLSGYCILSGDEMFRVTGQCENPACDQMRIELIAPDQVRKSLHCIRQRGTTWYLRFSGEEKHEEPTTLWKRFPVRTEHAMDYMSSIDCTYPVLNMPSFDAWISGLMRTWSDGVREYAIAKRDSLGTPGPDDRWVIRASAWADITLLTEEKISGILTQFIPAQNRYARVPFVFDVRSGKAETIQDYVRKPQFEHFLTEDAKKRMPHTQKAFKYISLSEQGFLIHTDFDHVEGDSWVLLPYQDYVTALKRNTVIQELMHKS